MYGERRDNGDMERGEIMEIWREEYGERRMESGEWRGGGGREERGEREER
jgi:hypothetical protein